MTNPSDTRIVVSEQVRKDEEHAKRVRADLEAEYSPSIVGEHQVKSQDAVRYVKLVSSEAEAERILLYVDACHGAANLVQCQRSFENGRWKVVCILGGDFQVQRRFIQLTQMIGNWDDKQFVLIHF